MDDDDVRERIDREMVARACGYCGVDTGVWCVTKGGYRAKFLHADRWWAWREEQDRKDQREKDEMTDTIEERHTLSIADPSGDTRIMWDPKNRDEVATAKAAFDEAKKKGMLAYAVDPESADKGEVIREFDPKAGKIIMSRALQGG